MSIHILVFDGYADWEPSYALAELRRSGGHQVVTVGLTGNEVTSMGGLHVRPDRALADVHAEDVQLFILPGGDMWEREDAYPHADLEVFLEDVLTENRPVAAICGATIALARAGLLDDRRHTSNMPSYLSEHAPSYRGAALYEPNLAVYDRCVITASGLGPVEFARAIFEELGVFSDSDRAVWYEMFKHGKLPEGIA